MNLSIMKWSQIDPPIPKYQQGHVLSTPKQEDKSSSLSEPILYMGGYYRNTTDIQTK